MKTSEKEFMQKLHKNHADNIVILSEFLGEREPITYSCKAKKHKVTVSKAYYVLHRGCVKCQSYSVIKKFKYRFRSKDEKFPIKKLDYILPPPFNGYYLRYTGKAPFWRVFSALNELKKPSKNDYSQYNLSVNGKKTTMRLHRMVYSLKVQNWDFLKLVKDKFTIDHKDRDLGNNHPRNIRLVHSKIQNTNKRNCIISSPKVLSDMLKLSAKGWSQRKIAKKYDCTQATISKAFIERKKRFVEVEK